MLKGVKKHELRNYIHETFSYGIIYVYSIPLETHHGRLKIGSATINHPNPTEEQIRSAACERIEQQTKTADISYTLEHAELAVTNKEAYFADYDVHQVLIRSGYKRKSENVRNTRSEWFEIDLGVAKKAIQAVKESRQSLTTKEKTASEPAAFPFRPNQREAIDKTLKAITKKRKHFLWNAKMRFGKTSAAMQVAKEAGMKNVLIVTHRPSVNVDWSADFKEIFGGTDYQYASRTEGQYISALVKGTKPFVYFASLQDLRGSKRARENELNESLSGGFDKNDEIFDTTWDMLIVDEAHEGTQTNLGETSLDKIPNNFKLELSGTPFNILHKHEEEDIYEWDYVREQEEKLHWDERNPGVPNPYAELPALKMFTYDIDNFGGYIGGLGDQFMDTVDGAFKFHEFFRVHKDEEENDTAKFVHEPMVKKFLDLLVDNSIDTKFPYATEEYRNHNKHSLWLLPNRVKMIEAMEKLLKEHWIFGSGQFGIVNISGDSRDEEDEKDAKERVTKAISKYDRTITITGQRLTTGASIKEWTAVFMMSDTNSAAAYLQTAFRCQTPAKIDGKLKTQGYVFDFAPDRTLRLVAEAIELNHKPGKSNSIEQKEAMEQFLNFCPILAASGGSMKPYDVSGMLRQLKRAIAERVYRSGFEDPKLYNDELLQLSEVDIKRFNELKALVGSANSKQINEIEINNQGLDGPLQKKAEEAEKKKKKGEELSEEQKEALKMLQEARKQKLAAISILRAVSIRMPMLVYGANVSVREDITLKKFIDLVDEESWEEFMPPGLTKEQFREFTKYYDEDVFKEVAHSIRAKAYDCDSLLPTERVQAIAEIFSTFKNPDKETVLTPWNVVNKHLTQAFGGHDFSTGVTDKAGKPEWKSRGVDTSVWEREDTKILEINSKSGMYPLLAAYNVYTRKLKHQKKPEDKVAHILWRQVLEENIYVLCKSPMAKSITLRTLVGYQGAKANIVYIENLVQKLQRKDKFKSYVLKDELLAKFKQPKDMKFKAVVGNPPYQINTDTNFSTPVYHLFFEAAKSLHPDYVSLIHPARFLFNAGATPKEWNKQMLNDPHLSVVMYEPNSQKIFQGVEIKGGVCVTFWDKHNRSGGLGGIFLAHEELGTILAKIKADGLDKIITPQTKTSKPIDKLFPTELRIRPNYFEKFPNIFEVNKKNGFTVRIFGLEKGNKRTERYVKRELINDPNLETWKVFLPESNNSGVFGEPLSTPFVGDPLTGNTGSYIQIGSFESRVEAQNCMKYVKTKFCRALLATLKVTQHNPKNVWKNVPLQDFTSKSGVDWSKTVAEIDQQLYKKYGLDKKEIDFIETHVKPMS